MESTATIPSQVGDVWRTIVVPQTVQAGTTLFSITIGGVPYKFTKNTALTYVAGKMMKFSIRVDKKKEDGKYRLTLISESIAPWENDLVSHDATAKEYVVVNSTAGHLKEAIQTARKGVARWPDSTEMAFLLGNLYSDNGNRKEALEVMESILRKEPDNYQALNYVGYTLAEENRDIERAITLLTKANSLAPRQFYILDSLAWAHYRAGHLDQAWNFIREACQLDSSDDSTIWEHYGDIALAKNMKSEAKNGYKKALRGNPPNADEIRRKLEAIQAK